ncbi:MAG: peptidyl-prolyl cis-trans isomerase [Campylobacteraceae bacterium]|nr:peptidyl-prolyl cis-trans isomerase [Campylobacteraceae bacterium]
MKIKLNVLTLVTLGATLLISPLSAGVVDGVSVIINKEPITLFDVYKYSGRFNISKKEALDILVRQKLEESEIKKLNISVDAFEVDQYIENLAISNNVSQFDFLNMIKSKNIDVAEYKEDVKSKIKRDKLYKKIVSNKMQQMGDSELLAYYNDNLGEFSQASSFDVTVYTSNNQQNLTSIQENPMSVVSNVELKDTSLEATKIDPKLAMMLNSTQQGKFSTVVKSDPNYVMFFVKNKNNVKSVSFAEAKNYIYSKLAESKEQKAIEEYFEKLKSSASINVVRAP